MRDRIRNTGRKALAGLFLAGLLLLAGGCGGKEKERVQITLLHGWGTMEEDHIRMQKIYEDFEKAYPSIDLQLVSMTSSEEVVRKAGELMTIGRIPDLIFTSGHGKESIYRFMKEEGLAVDLLPFIQEDKEFAEDIAPEILQIWARDGNLYTVTDVLLPAGGYWYREDIFQEAGIAELPSDWEGFLTVCQKLRDWAERKDKELIPVQITRENSVYFAGALMADEVWRTGKEVGPEGLHPGDLGQEACHRVLQTMKEIYDCGRYRDEELGYRDAVSAFNRGEAAMYVNGVWGGALIDPKLPVAYAAFPSKYRGSQSCLSAGVGYLVGNTGDEERIRASVTFLKYMLSDEVQEKLLTETGQIPSNPSIDMEMYQQQLPRLYQAVQAVREADRILEVPANSWSNAQLDHFQTHIMDFLGEETEEMPLR